MVLIVGMHRSGTSALAGMMARLGANLGPELVPAQAGVNDWGFWENRRVLDLHERLLKALGSGWNAIGSLPDRWWGLRQTRCFLDELVDLVAQDYPEDRLNAVKDPRLCRLLPLWRLALERLGRPAAAVLIHRHPVEVAESLARRDGMDRQTALLLWLRHNLEAESLSRGLPRAILDYAGLLADWVGQAERIASSLSLDWPVSPGAVTDAPVTAALRHIRGTAEPLPDLVTATWDALERAGGPQGIATERFDVLHHELASANALYEDLLGREQRRIGQISAGLAEAKAQIEQYQAATKGFADACAELRDREAEIDELRGALRTSAALLRQRETELARHRAELPPASRGAAPPPGAQARDSGTEAAETDYAGEIDLAVENNSHTKMYRMIEASGRGRRARILDVGCASGYFGGALKELGHEVWGVEIGRRAGDRAKARLDRVYLGGIEAFLADSRWTAVRFDCIVFGDVLEHLVDACTVLQQCRERLAPGGIIVASIPNVAHQAVRAMLLEGRWEYSPMGILDSTHLRFYTQATVVELMSRTGLRVERLDRVSVPAPATGIAYHPALLDAVSRLASDSETEVFQYVLCARSDPRAAVHNLRFMPGVGERLLLVGPPYTRPTADDAREQVLARLRQSLGYDLRRQSADEVEANGLSWASTVILDLGLRAQALALARSAKAQGKRVVAVLDDLPGVEEPRWRARRRSTLSEGLLARVDLVVTPSPALARAVADRVPLVRVVPEVPPVGPSPDHPRDGRVTLFLGPLAPARVEFLIPVLAGLQAEGRIRLVAIGAVARHLQAAGLAVARHETLDYPVYQALLARLPDPLGLIPADPARAPYGTGLRYREYALAGIPTICSAQSPEAELIVDGVDGLLCTNDAAEWERGIRALLADRSLRERIGRAAHERALEAASNPSVESAWQEALGQLSRARPHAVPAMGEAGERAAERVLALLPVARWSLGDVRLVEPLSAWRRSFGGEVRIYGVNEYPREALDWATTVVFQREANPGTLRLAHELREAGKRVVFDLDDLLTEVPKFLSVYRHARRVRPLLVEMLRRVDVVTVTTPRLQREIERYNKSVRVISNCAFTRLAPTRHTAEGIVTLIVASTDTVRVDFIVATLRRILAAADRQVRILGIGPPGTYLTEAGLAVETLPNLDYAAFKALLAEQDDAIGVIPLDDSRFSGCKSAIKYVDYSLAGIPCVCSAVPPYADVIEDGVTGVLCANNGDDWYEALHALAGSSQRRTMLANNARHHCLEVYSMDRAADGWGELLSEPAPSGNRGRPARSRPSGLALLRFAMNRHTIRVALRVLRIEGIGGLRARLARYL
jgi:2-polyprenyl-3-methyl-5-hydroxy-6-metoxy-1,4-benzoquinol methylase/glycosyltransferase involved in cell wall biosynthesis